MQNYSCPLCKQVTNSRPLRLYMELDEEDAASIASGIGGIDQLMDQLSAMSLGGRYGATAKSDSYIFELREKLHEAEEKIKKQQDELDAKKKSEDGLREEVSRLNHLSYKHRESIRGLQIAVNRRNEKIDELEDELYGSDNDDDDSDDYTDDDSEDYTDDDSDDDDYYRY
ncbi:hypothetical protein LPJ75_007100 [Coemansia sp. RSA 2598]|nr:hypothetical protein LPJ75_007100 [Coemansia sp. RSA 2598]